MPPGIKNIYEELSYRMAVDLARDLGMPVHHVPSGTTYWPSGHVQVPPLTMPKGTKRSRSGSLFGRKGGFSEKGLPSDVNMLQAVRIAESKIKKSVGIELGGMCTHIDQAAMLGTYDTTGGIIGLNFIKAGNGEWERRGNKVTLKNVRIHGVLTHAATETGLGSVKGNVARMVIVWDKSPNGVLPKFDDIFGCTFFGGLEETHFLSAKRFDNTNRFQILRDMKIAINPSAPATKTTGAMTTRVVIDEFIKLGDRVTQYKDTPGNTVASVSSGGLYIVWRANSDETGVSVISFDGQARLRYMA